MADFSQLNISLLLFKNKLVHLRLKERDRAASFRITEFTQLCMVKNHYLLSEWNCEKSKPAKVSCLNQFIGNHQAVSIMGIPENLYACAVCEKSFPIAKSLVDHVNKSHVKSLPSKIKPKKVKETKIIQPAQDYNKEQKKDKSWHNQVTN